MTLSISSCLYAFAIALAFIGTVAASTEGSFDAKAMSQSLIDGADIESTEQALRELYTNKKGGQARPLGVARRLMEISVELDAAGHELKALSVNRKALEILSGIAGKSPRKMAEVCYLKGLIHETLQDTFEAERCFEKSLSYDGDHYGSLQAMKRYEEPEYEDDEDARAFRRLEGLAQ